MTLAEFLAARLDDDQAAAKAAFGPGIALNWPALPAPVDAFIDRYGPIRVVREVAAKRAILAEHEQAVEHKNGPLAGYCACQDYGGVVTGSWPCVTLRAFAAIYSDHPDYPFSEEEAPS